MSNSPGAAISTPPHHGQPSTSTAPKYVPIVSGSINLKPNAATNAAKPIDKGFLYKLLRNRLYLGEAAP